jgi:hypothetical protein
MLPTCDRRDSFHIECYCAYLARLSNESFSLVSRLCLDCVFVILLAMVKSGDSSDSSELARKLGKSTRLAEKHSNDAKYYADKLLKKSEKKRKRMKEIDDAKKQPKDKDDKDDVGDGGGDGGSKTGFSSVAAEDAHVLSSK